MTNWMAGAKIQEGQVIGASDEFGYKAAVEPHSIHDLHATILYLLGMDHTRLTYSFNGRHMRLTDVYGDPIPQIVASQEPRGGRRALLLGRLPPGQEAQASTNPRFRS